MKTGIVIQARLGSTRLPKKVLLSITKCDNLLQLIVNKLRRLNLPVVVATTDNIKDDELVTFLETNQIDYYRGEEQNVLKRFTDTADHFGFDRVIRVCADNPFIDIPYLSQLLDLWDFEIDYFSYSYDGKPVILSHFGVFAECVSIAALKNVEQSKNVDRLALEHVTYGVYTNGDMYRTKLIDLTDSLRRFDGIRLTIDTDEDYENILKIVKELDPTNTNLRFEEVAEFVLEQTEIYELMRKNILSNQK